MNKSIKPHQSSFWLPGGHLQTVYPFLLRRQVLPVYQRHKVNTPDGDFIHIDSINDDQEGPLVVLLHGLEGSSRSHYARAFMNQINRINWSGYVINFRGCSGEPNELARAYHSGDSDELEWIFGLDMIQRRTHVFVVGFSLGGNVLLNWLGQEKYHKNHIIDGAATVSAPYDLVVAGNRLSSGITRLYGNHFLRSLKEKALHKIKKYDLSITEASIRAVTTLKQFDDRFTAPVHGFKNVLDYWGRASSKHHLGQIKRPIMLIHAKNDPFLPGNGIKRLTENNRNIHLNLTNHGGHVGFTEGGFPGNTDYLPHVIIRYFKELL